MAAMTSTLSFRTSVLPWALSHEDEHRFRRIFLFVVLMCLCFGVVLPWLPHPSGVPEKGQALPPPIAKLLLERPVTPPPPPPQVAKIEVPKEQPKTNDTEPAPLPTKPLNHQKPVPEARNPQPNKPPGEDQIAARNRAAGVGLLAALKDSFPEQHGAPMAVQLNQDIKPGPGVGSGTGVGVGAGKEAGLPDRNMITSNATGGSGGINTAGYSRDTGGGGLAGRSTTLVAGVAGGGGGGGYGGGGGVYGTGGHGTGTGKAGGSVQKGASGKASRSIEEVRLVLERAKGSLYAIYNRALRDDPTLRGKVVIEFTIAPSGAVTNCRFVSSELQAPELEQKLLARFRMLAFGPEDVDTLITTYPIDFLPSG
jgi:TonB family protein